MNTRYRLRFCSRLLLAVLALQIGQVVVVRRVGAITSPFAKSWKKFLNEGEFDGLEPKDKKKYITWYTNPDNKLFKGHPYPKEIHPGYLEKVRGTSLETYYRSRHVRRVKAEAKIRQKAYVVAAKAKIKQGDPVTEQEFARMNESSQKSVIKYYFSRSNPDYRKSDFMKGMQVSFKGGAGAYYDKYLKKRRDYEAKVKSKKQLALAKADVKQGKVDFDAYLKKMTVSDQKALVKYYFSKSNPQYKKEKMLPMKPTSFNSLDPKVQAYYTKGWEHRQAYEEKVRQKSLDTIQKAQSAKKRDIAKKARDYQAAILKWQGACAKAIDKQLTDVYEKHAKKIGSKVKGLSYKKVAGARQELQRLLATAVDDLRKPIQYPPFPEGLGEIDQKSVESDKLRFQYIASVFKTSYIKRLEAMIPLGYSYIEVHEEVAQQKKRQAQYAQKKSLSQRIRGK